MGYFIFGSVLLICGLLTASLAAQLSTRALRTTIFAALFLAGALGLAFMAFSGRYALAAPIGFLLLWVVRLWRAAKPSVHTPAASSAGGAMTRAQALDVLGLYDHVTRADIELAYKALMVKNHPDQGGTDWLAARLNEARDCLLNRLNG